MGVKERREREKTELRERILTVAREMFVTQGYDAVSMRKIADQLEYSPTAIYLHFKDKEDLIHALCDRDYRALAGEFQQIAKIADPIERLKKLGLTYVEFGIKYPNHYRLMFMTPHPEMTPEDSTIRRGNPDEDAYAMLKTTVMQALKEGRFRPECKDGEMLSQLFWASVHGIVSLHIAKQHDHWVEWRPLRKTAELIINANLYGLLTDAEKKAAEKKKEKK